MQRMQIQPRSDWQAKVQDLGLVWHSVEDRPYWNESVYYQFTLAEIERLEAATNELYQMFLVAGQFIIDENLFDKFGIPPQFVPYIIKTWNEEVPALNYGRFDLGYNGKDIKLFEYNADTPTSLIEAAVVQWGWKEEVFPVNDQWNIIYDALVAKWADIKDYIAEDVYFAHFNDDAGEDSVTTTLMRDIATEAGINTIPLFMEQIGWNGSYFTDPDENCIDCLYKLYPWEWLVNEDFGKYIPGLQDEMLWIEPIWKMIWSNKAILPILWQLYPNHPLLLETSFAPLVGKDYVKKPILSREGANITIEKNGVLAQTTGAYDETHSVYQEFFELPSSAGLYPVLGSWTVDGQAVGLGIREGGLITNNTAQFVPHIIKG